MRMAPPLREEWRGVPGLEDRYAISNRGRVRSVSRWIKNPGARPYRIPSKMLTLRNSPSGLECMLVVGPKKFRQLSVRRLVLSVFGGAGDKGRGYYVHHIDGNSRNCALSNLEWRPLIERYRPVEALKASA